MTVIEMNNYTLDLEITENWDLGSKGNKLVITQELFSTLMESSVFHAWLETMNLKIGAKK